MEPQSKSCPSAPCTEGAKVLGVINEDREVQFLNFPLPVTDGFIKSVAEAGDPEKRFRFSNKCVKSGCSQWTGTRCGVIDKVMDGIESRYWKNHLPDCSIRDTCRWFSQNGADACRVCPLVVTDSR